MKPKLTKIEREIKKLFTKPKHKKGTTNKRSKKPSKLKPFLVNIGALGVLFIIIVAGFGFIWISSLQIPSFDNFEERTVAQSTKIYDRKGETILFDINQDIRREIIPLEEMGQNIQNATIAIEDDTFYEHNGFRLTAFLRALRANIIAREFSQGGSTITQQIVKNALLTNEKKISRKIKEIVLALRIEKVLTKDEILEIYLNEIPYGGSIYGIKEAARSFFNKNPDELTVAEAAHLAAIPQAPTFFSPYGNNLDRLESRKNLVLSQMRKIGFITEEEYQEARDEVVEFIPRSESSIKAPHFVFMIREYLEETYGKDVVEQGGLKVITTLNWELQAQAEEIVKENALANEAAYNASNAALVAMDPGTGEILTLVGSRDYFDENIDGKFNVATALRQPGSSFKPFVYATAFEKGYTAETVLFDVKTEFQGTCDETGTPLPGFSQSNCYSPENYDNQYKGPLTVRQALAQSRNIPSVKLLYLAGLSNSVQQAKNMGLNTLGNPNFYGLTLVLGGGEVRLLDMVTAYGVFASEGIKRDPVFILEVQDSEGNILEEAKQQPGTRVLSANSARLISSILDDDQARVGLFGSVNNFMYFGNRNVAGKTGTTNNNRDAWMMGYTPEIVVGVWSGNNDNSSMTRGSAISGSLWRDFMNIALPKVSATSFTPPEPNTATKPALRGVWQGGEGVEIDTISGKLATQWTPEETRQTLITTNVHSILHWVNRNNPQGPIPSNPQSDSQYSRWEYAVQNWWNTSQNQYTIVTPDQFPTEYDDVHTPETQPSITLTPPTENPEVNRLMVLQPQTTNHYDIDRVEYYINNELFLISRTQPFTLGFTPEEPGIYSIKAVVVDSVFNRAETELQIQVN